MTVMFYLIIIPLVDTSVCEETATATECAKTGLASPATQGNWLGSILHHKHYCVIVSTYYVMLCYCDCFIVSSCQ